MFGPSGLFKTIIMKPSYITYILLEKETFSRTSCHLNCYYSMWDLFNYIYEIDEFEEAEKTMDFYELL